jgi:hypothetical protein
MIRLLLLFSILTATIALPVHAAEKVWGALVLAENAGNPKPIPGKLAPYEKRLNGVFGYNQYKLLGEKTRKLEKDREKWLIPSKSIFARVIAQKHKGRGRLLNLQLYLKKKLLVETNAVLGPASPLFIRGPFHGQGQIIVILVVK